MGEFEAWVRGWEPMHWLAFAVFCAAMAISGGLTEIASAIKKAATPKGGAK